MKLSDALPRDTPRCVGLVILLSILTVSGADAASGPVPPGSLPGGGSVSDDDDGSGESWGRVGGRSLVFSGFDLFRFTVLQWGPVDGVSAGIAFDGAINPDEVLSYAAGGSELWNGVAIWTGHTSVQLNTGVTPVDTRLVLSVSDVSGPVALLIDPATGVPRVDALSTSGAFTVNLRMEAKLTTSPVYSPALDLFDGLKTGQGAAGDARTSLTHGFFFDSVEDLSVSKHDANMETRSNQIVGLMEFHNLETVGRLADLGLKHDAINSLVNQLFNEIQPLAPRSAVDGLRESFEEFQMVLFQYLWGIEFDEDGNPILESITKISSLARTRLDLQVVHSPSASGPDVSFLVLATENGAIVEGTTITEVVAISRDDYSPTPLEDFGVVGVAPGLTRLDLHLSGALNSTRTFLILAEHSEHEFGDEIHRGAILFSVGGDH